MEHETLKIATFLRRIEAHCARMNSGLSAVVVVLAATVLFMAAMRSYEIAIAAGPDFEAVSNAAMSAALPYSLATYN